MKRFIAGPNLPKNNVAEVLIGEKYLSLLEDSLKKYDIEIISVPVSDLLSEQVCGHVDMQINHLGDDRFIISPEIKCKVNRLDTAKLLPGNNLPGKLYPEDIIYNVARIGKYALHSFKYTDKALKDELVNLDIDLIDVRQGYSKCSICIVNENAVITADRGIYNALLRLGFDVLLISPQGVKLDGYDYGFIGGACGKISEKEIAFTGILDRHPDYVHILDFLYLHNVSPVFLTDMPCFDVGSILPVTEYI